MRLVTLGGLRLDGVDFGRRKPLLLLAYLAIEGPQVRRHVAELFWHDAKDPMASVRVALARLRKAALEALERGPDAKPTSTGTHPFPDDLVRDIEGFARRFDRKAVP